jgi:hypothetical protein
MLLIFFEKSEKHVELVGPAEYQTGGPKGQKGPVLTPVHLRHIEYVSEKVGPRQLPTDNLPNVKFVNVQVVFIADFDLKVNKEAQFHQA